MERVYAKLLRFYFEESHRTFCKPAAAKFRHDIEFIYKRIGAEKLETEAERKHDVANRPFVHYQKPDAPTLGMLDQSAKRIADEGLSKGARIRVRLLFGQGLHHRK